MSKFYYTSIFLLFSIPLLWLALQFDTALNANHAWFIEAAKRLLDGRSMSEAYFGTNPPLSILLYIPSVLLGYSGIIKPEYAHYTFTLICFGLSLPILNNLLKCFETIDNNRRYVLLMAYITANTIFTSSGELYFGERDQFIFIGLCIFSLYQLLITFKNIYRYEYVFMAVAVLFILLKPQYLLIPAVFILHRLYKTKDLKGSLYTADLYCLGGACILYILTILIMFPDYLTEVFPAIRSAYQGVSNPATMNIGVIVGTMIIASTLLAFITGLKFEKMKLPIALFGLSFLSCLLFWLQMKGLYHQIIPALGFWICGLGLLVYNVIKHYGGDKPYITRLAMIFIVAISFTLKPPKTALSHADYEQTPVFRIINECPPNCSFYMFGGNKDIIHQIAFYSAASHASRFPSLWWLDDALRNPSGELSQKFKTYMAQDLQFYSPDYLFFAQDIKIHDKSFDLLDYLSTNDAFNTLMKNYEFSHEIFDNRSNYYALGAKNQNRPMTFKIYKKIQELP